MKPIVYIDMLFLLNFLIDSVILYSVSLFARRNLGVGRLIFVSALSALYSSVMFFPQISFFYSALAKGIFLVFISLLAFPTRVPLELLKNSAVFFLVNLVYGGALMVLVFLTDFGTAVGSVVSNGIVYLDIKVSTLLSSVILAYITAYCVSLVKKESNLWAQKTVNLSIELGRNIITLCALCDTGCTLCDPLTSRPAVIISPKSAKELLPDKDFELLLSGEISPTLEGRYRILPFSTVDCTTSSLHGFLPDRVSIDGNEADKCIVAIAKTDLSGRGNISAILNPVLLENLTVSQPSPSKKFQAHTEI